MLARLYAMHLRREKKMATLVYASFLCWSSANKKLFMNLLSAIRPFSKSGSVKGGLLSCFLVGHFSVYIQLIYGRTNSHRKVYDLRSVEKYEIKKSNFDRLKNGPMNTNTSWHVRLSKLYEDFCSLFNEFTYRQTPKTAFESTKKNILVFVLASLSWN